MSGREGNMGGRGGEMGGRGGEMGRVRMLQLQIAENLRREYFRNGQASRENTVWVTLINSLLDEAREREASLERSYESFSRISENYISELDVFISTLQNYFASEPASDEEIKKREGLKEDIKKLEKKIEEKNELLEMMSNNMQGLERTIEELTRIRETPEFAILSNWTRATSDKCIELENEIAELRIRIGQKNADVLQFLGFGHNIFSKITIEDLKKLRPFITEPSTSSNTSSQ